MIYQGLSAIFIIKKLEHVYMRPEVNSNRFEISNHFEMSFGLYGNLRGDFTVATFQTIARYQMISFNYANLINAKKRYQ